MNIRNLRSSNRGSALVVAMILSAVVAISLTSYIRLGVSSQRISNRALYNNAAMNLAENGLEEAMYSINKMIADEDYKWTGWQNDGAGVNSNAWSRFPTTGDYTFDQNTSGFVRVYVKNYLGVSAPTIITRSTITMGGATSAPIEKWVEVTLAKASKFANGLVAKKSILFNGNNATVDSWNSEEAGAGTFTPFSDAVKNDKGSVGSVSVAVDSVLVKNADVWGYVSTNNAQDPTNNVGANGSVLGKDSTYDPSTWTTSKVDPSRVSTQFSANFDPVTNPTGTTDIAVPVAGDTVGTLGTKSVVRITSGISLAGSNNFVTFEGDVTLVIDVTEGSQAMKVTGSTSGFKIAAGSSLKIYTKGNMDIAGQGFLNATGAPKNLQIYGTSTSTSQDFKVAGGGTFSGVVYAPNASVTMNGSGSMHGSVVANNITLTGNANFHYDESLGNMGEGNPFRVAKWRELTSAADRKTAVDSASYLK
ncbi:MAG: hypothetical protein QG602_2883 [Verrucomicrobiota bacterium]|nr:hypothetical protein [Verrucomicrobiota bacterium]